MLSCATDQPHDKKRGKDGSHTGAGDEMKVIRQHHIRTPMMLTQQLLHAPKDLHGEDTAHTPTALNAKHTLRSIRWSG